MHYISSLTNAFGWVKNILSANTPADIDSTNVFQEITPQLSEPIPVLQTVDDWNYAGQSQIKDLTGLFTSINVLDSHQKTISSLNRSRFERANYNLQSLYQKFLVIKSVQDLGGSSVSLIGGALDNIDVSPKFYQTYPLLNSLKDKGIFKLGNTGKFSTIKSLGGSIAAPMIEHSNFTIQKITGNINSIVDGSNDTFWAITSWAKGMILNSANDLTWLSSSNKEGLSTLLTSKLERPVIISEIELSPVIENIAIVDCVSWTPPEIASFIENSTFTNSSFWDLTTYASIVTGEGVSGSALVVSSATGDWTEQSASYTFDVDTVFASSLAGVTSTASSYFDDHRLDVSFYSKGNGSYAFARINWLDSDGKVLNSHLYRTLTSNVYSYNEFSCYRPESATSGTIQLGVLDDSQTNAEIYFDDINATLGEGRWVADYKISGKTSITLPGRIVTDRISIGLVQKNPSRESGSSSLFRYMIGIQELDFLYQEYIPRGAIISLPLKPRQEIRKFWVTAEIDQSVVNGLSFVMFPYSDDTSYSVFTQPYLVKSKGLDLNPEVSTGETFEIFTTEEVDNGLVTSDNSTNIVVVEPSQIKESFDGTDRDGYIELTYPIHFKKTKQIDIQNFLNEFGVDLSFDPNASSILGISSDYSDERLDVLAGDVLISSIPSSGFVVSEGYVPIKITVETDRFVAHPDTNGKPTTSVVRTVENEVLERAYLSHQTETINSSEIGFNEWLSRTKVSELSNLGLVSRPIVSNRPAASVGYPFRLKYPNPEDRTILESIEFDPSQANTSKLKEWYDRLLANGKIQQSQNTVTRVTESKESQIAYQTKYSPIISGRTATAIKLVVETTSGDITVSPNLYTVNPDSGIIILTGNIPGGTLKATYSYAVFYKDKSQEDVTNTLPSFEGYLTRNVTNYDTNNPPVLKEFQPDPVRKNYNPIIEYYITADSEIVFSKSFFRYGDQPAKITVEYESLKIQPRFGVYVLRVSSPTQSPTIKSVVFNYKENGHGVQSE